MLALAAIALLYVFPYQPRINNPNENVRFYMTAAIVEHDTYAIDELRKRWGWVNDAGVRDGHFYSVKAPGTSLSGVPGYAAYRAYTRARGVPFERTVALWVCRVSAQIGPMLIWLFFFQRFLTRVSGHAVLRLAVLFSVALGSLLYGYALIFVSHTASALAAFSVIMLLYQRRHVSSVRAFGAGLCASLVTLFEYPGIVVSLPLALYALVLSGRRRVLAVSLGGLLPALAMMHFQWRAWGNPFTPGHHFLENPTYRALSGQGFFGATGFDAEAARALAFDPGFGLFPLTPLLAFAAFGAFVALRKPGARAAATVGLVAIFATFLAICTMNNWRGGWTVGPRYLAVVVPFLGFLALVGLDALAVRARTLAYGAAVGTTATGLVASGLVSAYYPHVPEALGRPLRDLVVPLMRHDFAPYNAGAYAAVYGTASMAPILVVFALVIVLLLGLALRGESWLRRVSVVLAASVSFAVTMAPLVRSASRDRAAQRALALVTREWSPAGHDELSALHATPLARRDALWARRVNQVAEALGRAGDRHFR